MLIRRWACGVVVVSRISVTRAMSGVMVLHGGRGGLYRCRSRPDAAWNRCADQVEEDGEQGRAMDEETVGQRVGSVPGQTVRARSHHGAINP